MPDESNDAIARMFVDETRQAIAQEMRRIRHSLQQLNEAQVWQRPHPQVNCVGTIIIHLCGNLRQWFLHGFAGEKDVRLRSSEFRVTDPIPKDELRERLSELHTQIDVVLAGLPSSVLLEPCCIQGFETTGLRAIYSTITHLEGHALQIAYITHMLTGEQYEPFWKPADNAQGI